MTGPTELEELVLDVQTHSWATWTTPNGEIEARVDEVYGIFEGLGGRQRVCLIDRMHNRRFWYVDEVKLTLDQHGINYATAVPRTDEQLAWPESV